MTQLNEILHANQNQNSGANEFRRLGKFQNKNLPTFKVRYNPKGARA